jgi:hypothetical protein
MLEYTNLYSQITKTQEILKDIEKVDLNEKEQKAKFVPVILYILCFVSAIILAINYFDTVEGPLKYVFIALAGFFNIPFILFYAVWYVQLKHEKPGLNSKSSNTNKVAKL